jgi:hypothetical protein
VAYAPINTLKSIAHEVWIADGPEINLSLGPIAIPFPTRMTVIRLPNDDLWIHSPIAPDLGLVEAVAKLGFVRHLIAPNTLHYWWLIDWCALFPLASAYALPGLERRAKRALPFYLPITSAPQEAWCSAIDQIIFEGHSFSEAAFFHKPSHTLILADLIENFELPRVKLFWMRWLVRLGHVFDPHGTTPLDMRMMFSGNMNEVQQSVEALLNWEPSRVLIAHGRWYDHNATAELHRAFHWAIPSDRSRR